MTFQFIIFAQLSSTIFAHALPQLDLGALASRAADNVPDHHRGVYTVPVYIPPNRNDDQYYLVDVNFNGQTLPLLVDTASADVFVADDQCDVVNPRSGCYLCETYKLGNTTLGPGFQTIVGPGPVSGNNSVIPVTIGGLKIDNLNTPLIYFAGPDEFQNGSWSGILGIGLRNISRNLYFNNHLPMMDEIISRSLLKDPVFSLSYPRLGDPQSPSKGKLTLGGIEKLPERTEIKYGNVTAVKNYNYPGAPLAAQTWNVVLQGIRMNGVDIPVQKGLIDPSPAKLYLTDIDSGSASNLFLQKEFDLIAAAFNGTSMTNGRQVLFDCSVPQLLELKYNDQWFPIDPLDMIIPSQIRRPGNTTVPMCIAALGIWTKYFSDSVAGVPFLRNVVTVHDYVSKELSSIPPRLGFVSTTDAAAAVERYSSVYKNRILS